MGGVAESGPGTMTGGGGEAGLIDVYGLYFACLVVCLWMETNKGAAKVRRWSVEAVTGGEAACLGT